MNTNLSNLAYKQKKVAKLIKQWAAIPNTPTTSLRINAIANEVKLLNQNITKHIATQAPKTVGQYYIMMQKHPTK